MKSRPLEEPFLCCTSTTNLKRQIKGKTFNKEKRGLVELDRSLQSRIYSSRTAFKGPLRFARPVSKEPISLRIDPPMGLEDSLIIKGKGNLCFYFNQPSCHVIQKVCLIFDKSVAHVSPVCPRGTLASLGKMLLHRL